MATTSNDAATLPSKSLVTIHIHIRIQSVHAVTEDYDPQHPPKDIHSIVWRHRRVDDNGHPFRIAGLKPEQLPPTIVVAFTTARDTLVSAPLDHRSDGSSCGYYTPHQGQDLIVTSRPMWKLANPTKQHSWHAAISSLSVRAAHRGGADLAACTFDLGDMLPNGGSAVVGSEHFNMGNHWRLCAAIELTFPDQLDSRELGLWQTSGDALVHEDTSGLQQQSFEQDDEEELYLDSEEEIEHNASLHDTPEGSVVDTELDFWDGAERVRSFEGRVRSAASGVGRATHPLRLQRHTSQAMTEKQLEPEPEPEPEPESTGALAVGRGR
jgi:hypothetical protein